MLIKDDLQRAIDHSNDELDIDAMYQRIRDDDMILLIAADSAGKIYASCIVEVREFDTGKRVLAVTTLNGYQMAAWLDELIMALRGVAVHLECSEVYATGRSGWLKKLKKHGFRPIYQTMTLEVD